MQNRCLHSIFPVQMSSQRWRQRRLLVKCVWHSWNKVRCAVLPLLVKAILKFWRWQDSNNTNVGSHRELSKPRSYCACTFWNRSTWDSAPEIPECYQVCHTMAKATEMMVDGKQLNGKLCKRCNWKTKLFCYPCEKFYYNDGIGTKKCYCFYEHICEYFSVSGISGQQEWKDTYTDWQGTKVPWVIMRE